MSLTASELKIAKGNSTKVTEFILLGFPDIYKFQNLLFIFLLLIYVVTMTGNLLIIKLVLSNHQLQSPMYFFLTHLSVCDILISTNVTPNTLEVILKGQRRIHAVFCEMQLYFYGGSCLVECALLTAMSYDRYLAICNPLRYSSIMTNILPHYLALICWVGGLSLASLAEILICELDFCGPNTINHFFCDLGPLLELSCSDTKGVDILVSITIIVVVMSQLFFVIGTYFCIFKSILQISSTTGRQKVFSTCSSHLTVVCIYYGTLITIYVAPSSKYSVNLSKLLSLLNTVITPLFNPIIYCLRNKEIKIVVSKILNKHF